MTTFLRANATGLEKLGYRHDDFKSNLEKYATTLAKRINGHRFLFDGMGGGFYVEMQHSKDEYDCNCSFLYVNPFATEGAENEETHQRFISISFYNGNTDCLHDCIEMPFNVEYSLGTDTKNYFEIIEMFVKQYEQFIK
jgi:hypothetical protein